MPDLESRGWDYLESRFEIEREELEKYELRERSGDLWIVSPELETGLDIETHGIRMIRDTGIGLKPTTYGLQLVDEHIEKNVVEMSRKETLKMLKREEMIERDFECEGYVALKFDGKVIGCGFYKGRKVSSRIPEARGEELADILSA